MNFNTDHIDDLLGKFLAGEASEEEIVLAQTWINAGDENRKYFEQLKTIFSRAALVKDVHQFNTDEAWNKVRSEITVKQKPVIPIDRGRSISSWWSVAAAILVLAVAALYFYRNNNGPAIEMVEVVAQQKSVSDTLPDGTDVFLNKETKLVYAFDKKAKKHAIKLKGEAYFNVKHAKQEELVVEADGVFVRDIGTSFNVKAYPDSDEVEVLVEEGEVVFYTAENPGIHLKKSGRAVYNKKLKVFSIDQPDPNITAYKTKFFVFTSTKLGDIVSAVNNVYDRKIIISENLKSCPLTVSFKDETLEEISSVIAETLDLTVSSDSAKNILLQGKGCQ